MSSFGYPEHQCDHCALDFLVRLCSNSSGREAAASPQRSERPDRRQRRERDLVKATTSSRWSRPVLLALLVACSVAACATSAAAEEFPEFWTGCPTGSGAGQCGNRLLAIATSPTNGHVYVGDPENGRIDEFTAWKQFVKSWGWGVLDGKAEPEACTSQTGCLPGLPGGGAGQVSAPLGIAADSE